MKEPSEHGRHYWCVRIPEELSADDETLGGTLIDPTKLFLYADRCTILPSGALEFRRITRDEKTGEQVECINLAFAPGEWICVYAADREDGHAIAVEG